LRTAIFGGTFDPVHLGHIKMANQAIRQFDIKELIVVPNGNPPHKTGVETASFEHRYNMLLLAFEGMNHITVSDYEANENVPSYSLDTMRHFRNIYGEDTAFIIGADSLLTIHKWYEYRTLLEENTLIVFKRKGDSDLSGVAREYTKKYGAKILFADMDYVDISSTMIRDALFTGTDCDSLLPRSVFDYIQKNAIYDCRGADILKKLKGSLTPERFSHTLGVAKTAQELAVIYGVDTKKAYIAALLHDCAKCFGKEELKQKMGFYGIVLDKDSENSPWLWHSYVGAYEAKHIYKIDDEDIFNAIYYHTIGRAGMSVLEQIIYLADAIEPGRNYGEVDELRALAKKSLQKAVEKYTLRSIDYVISRGLKPHPNAYEVAEFYRRQK